MDLITYITEQLKKFKDDRVLLDKTFKKTKYVFDSRESVQDGSFDKQIQLKKSLSGKLNGSFDNEYANKWIVHEWGGIKSFKIDERVSNFKKELGKGELNRQSYTIISSLSKIASFVNPKEYFVYDSRVAYSLNVLIMEYNQSEEKNNDESYFQVPSSKGGRTEVIRRAINSKNGIYFNPTENYSEYLKLIKELYRIVYKGENGCPYKVEMILFALGATGGEMEQRLKDLSPNAFLISSAPESTKKEAKSKQHTKLTEGGSSLCIYKDGKTIQILGSTGAVFPADKVIIQYNGEEYMARVGTYNSDHYTLRDKNHIKKELIEANGWQPGQEFQCEFSEKDGTHIYKIK